MQGNRSNRDVQLGEGLAKLMAVCVQKHRANVEMRIGMIASWIVVVEQNVSTIVVHDVVGPPIKLNSIRSGNGLSHVTRNAIALHNIEIQIAFTLDSREASRTLLQGEEARNVKRSLSTADVRLRDTSKRGL